MELLKKIASTGHLQIKCFHLRGELSKLVEQKSQAKLKKKKKAV